MGKIWSGPSKDMSAEIPVEEIMFKYIFKNKTNKNLPTQGRLNQLIICANILIMLIYKN